MAKCIKFNENNELQVIADNIDVLNKNYTELSGNFTISAQDVIKLITGWPKNNMIAMTAEDKCKSRYYIISNNAAISDLINRVNELYEANEKLQKQLDKTNDNDIAEIHSMQAYYTSKISEQEEMYNKIPKWIRKLFLKNID